MAFTLATVVGARPQFVKAAVVSRALAALDGAGAVREALLHTGQHFDDGMSSVFFREMGIPKPVCNLGVQGGGHGQQTGRMLEKLEEALREQAPDMVLVYGDGNSCLAGALAAVKLHIPVAHVEAGLRSHNRRMAEEINRVLTDHISDILFCPTEQAVNNLAREGMGLPGGSRPLVRLVGDVMFDASLVFREKARPPDFALPGDFVLATMHRAETVDDPNILRQAFQALSRVAEAVSVVLPLHPRTRKRLEAANLDPVDFGVLAVPPVGYLEMLYLLDRCGLVLTDSGGLQKEAYFSLKPCLILREETEWVELADMDCNRIVGTDPKAVWDGFRALRGASVKPVSGLYGDGGASEGVARGILDFLQER